MAKQDDGVGIDVRFTHRILLVAQSGLFNRFISFTMGKLLH